MKIRIGTRGSKLALIQTEYVKERLLAAYPNLSIEVVVVKTKGDLVTDRPLSRIGGSGVFVKEIERKLLDGEIDMAVHSMKDMPALLPEGLVFSKTWKREDARDVLVLRQADSVENLPESPVIGTGSPRRERQIKAMIPGAKVVGIRGNVETRLQKMEEQKMDGIVLAAAGLKRLGMEKTISVYLDEEKFIPAPAQGALALEVKEDNKELLVLLNALADEKDDLRIRAERSFLREIGADCHSPVGAGCTVNDTMLNLQVVFGKSDEQEIFYASQTGMNPEEIGCLAAKEIRRQMAGTVYLVGAGPGDAELITVKGQKRIREADCLVYDRLVSEELLAMAKSNCEKIYVGKENHHHTMKQDEINKLLVRKAMEYKTVVRLKGGDPYVFGRGGEEAIELKKAGVNCEVISGITSPIAGLAAAGIPITHRGVSQGFHVYTAHSAKVELAQLDFAAIAQCKETSVFLMGLSKLWEICDKLKDEGMRPDMPVAVVSEATTEAQQCIVGTIETICELVKKSSVKSPAIIAIGDVIDLQKNILPEEKTLWGKRYVIAKIQSETTRLGEMLCRNGATVQEIQVGKIEKIQASLTREFLMAQDYLLFSSKNAVRYFFENMREQGLDARSIANGRIAVVGEKTAQCLAEYNLIADLVASKGANGLAELVAVEIENNQTSANVLYIKAEYTDNDIVSKLSTCSNVTELPVYRNVPVEFVWDGQVADGYIFTCASGAERFVTKVGCETVQPGEVISIGPTCTAKLKELGVMSVFQAEQCNYDGIAKLCVGMNKCR